MTRSSWPARARRAVGGMLTLVLIAALGLLLWGIAKGRPQDLPWTPLDLGQPIGFATGAKLNRLGGNFLQCRALLTGAGIGFTRLPPRHDGERCGYDDAVRLTAGGARQIGLRPQGLGISCGVAASLAVWEWEVIQPAAQARFGARVVAIDHFGSYACRRLYGRDTGSWSEHASANAVDIAGFRLSDGTRITVARDWASGGAKAAFLHDVRDGACRLFATTLSPDYNAAHHDHLHLDQARRGSMGWRACR